MTYDKLSGAKKGYWAACMASTVHAVLNAIWASSSATKANLWDSNDYFEKAEGTDIQTCCFAFMGYLVSDLALALYYHSKWPGWLANIGHHVVIGYAFYQCASRQCALVICMVTEHF